MADNNFQIPPAAMQLFQNLITGGMQFQNIREAEIEQAVYNALRRFAPGGSSNLFAQTMTSIFGQGQYNPATMSNLSLVSDIVAMTKLGQMLGMDNPMMQQNIMRGWMDMSATGLMTSKETQYKWLEYAETARDIGAKLDADSKFAFRGNVSAGDIWNIQDWLLKTQNITFDQMGKGPLKDETFSNAQSDLMKKTAAATKAVFYGKNLLGMGDDINNILNVTATLGGGVDIEASVDRFVKQVDAALNSGLKIMEMQDAMSKSMTKIQSLISTGMDADTAASIVFPASMSAAVLRHRANLEGKRFDAEDASNRLIQAQALTSQTESGRFAKAVAMHLDAIEDPVKRKALADELANSKDIEATVRGWETSEDADKRLAATRALEYMRNISPAELDRYQSLTAEGKSLQALQLKRDLTTRSMELLQSAKGRLSENDPEARAKVDELYAAMAAIKDGTFTAEQAAVLRTNLGKTSYKAALKAAGINPEVFSVFIQEHLGDKYSYDYAENVRKYISNMNNPDPFILNKMEYGELISKMGGAIDPKALEQFYKDNEGVLFHDPRVKGSGSPWEKLVTEGNVKKVFTVDNIGGYEGVLNQDTHYKDLKDEKKAQAQLIHDIYQVALGHEKVLQVGQGSVLMVNKGGKLSLLDMETKEEIDFSKLSAEQLEKYNLKDDVAKAFAETTNNIWASIQRGFFTDDKDNNLAYYIHGDPSNPRIHRLTEAQMKAMESLKREYQVGDSLDVSALKDKEQIKAALLKQFEGKITEEQASSLAEDIAMGAGGKGSSDYLVKSLGEGKGGVGVAEGMVSLYNEEGIKKLKEQQYSQASGSDKTAMNTEKMSNSLTQMVEQLNNIAEGKTNVNVLVMNKEPGIKKPAGIPA